jgi:uncharacterized protein
MDLRFTIRTVVVQPTTLCNLDCAYCDLPDRAKRRHMPREVADCVAASLAELGWPVKVVWHAGEPLACGVDHLASLTAPFEALVASGHVVHHLQTNGTLLDDRWCDLFDARQIAVGVSIDGPRLFNRHRVDWQGRPSYDRIRRGLATLVRRRPFAILSVVGNDMLEHADVLYQFLCESGCTSAGILIEEAQNLRPRPIPDDGVRVRRFWEQLLEAWVANPAIEVRDFRQLLDWMTDRAAGTRARAIELDLIPAVAANGDVSLLSPQFVNHSPFVAGNVRRDSVLAIAQRWHEQRYVQDFIGGLNECRRTCAYFAYCEGGNAANKHIELGTTSGTETAYCRNSQQRLADAVLRRLGSRAPEELSDLGRAVRARAPALAALLADVDGRRETRTVGDLADDRVDAEPRAGK